MERRWGKSNWKCIRQFKGQRLDLHLLLNIVDSTKSGLKGNLTKMEQVRTGLLMELCTTGERVTRLLLGVFKKSVSY